MLNLKAKPFNLTQADIQWVQETLAGMDTKTKVGQLFTLVIFNSDLTEMMQELQSIGIKPGGFMARPFPGAMVQQIYRTLQESAEIPLLLAANLEKGGDGIAMDGTAYGTQMQIAATDDETMAYHLGLVAGREGRAVGCNWAFAPVIDIDFNFSNPITNTRTYGSDPERVLRMAHAYMKGIHECGLAVSIKHWPGDGVDARDQHLVTSVNSLSVEEWDASYGKVYKSMIHLGADTVMVGHIMQPAYSRKLRPGIKDTEIMPASLAPELYNDLLREQLGFNGLISSDATSMAGMTVAMPREMAVPHSIAAGCDVFLFALDLKQDFEYMLKGVADGRLTMERLDEAVTRILALKASLKLHTKKQDGMLVPDESALSVLNCAEHRAWAKECADKAVTLVKDTQHILPLSPEKHRRVLLYILGDTGGYMDDSGGGTASSKFVKLLRGNGFDVTQFDYSQAGENMWTRRESSPITQLKENYDLVLYFASLKTASNQTIVRINWAQPMGLDTPKYVKDIPTVFVSVDNPYHLQDVPMVKTFVNGYSSNEFVVEAVVEKLLGKSPFKGINPVDPFCGYWDATL
ncbi:MAG: glycoside hydrolase family 3 N-terminal domain-containing protein [Chloroflexota bacterium]